MYKINPINNFYIFTIVVLIYFMNIIFHKEFLNEGDLMIKNNMLDFEWLNVHSKEYLDISQEWQPILHKFYSYEKLKSELGSLKSQKKKKKKSKGKSGKPDSYRNYLVRILFNYPKYFDVPAPMPDDYRNYFFINNLNKLTSFPNFKKFNNDKNSFPSATIHAFTKFAILSDEEQKQAIDTTQKEIDQLQEGITLNNLSPKPKVSLQQNRYSKSHTRDPSVREACLTNAGHKCEYNNKHTSFPYLHDTDIVQYTEGHHLIPVSVQDQFEYENGKKIPLDTIHNMVSLCATCHTAVHHAIYDVRGQMLAYLYLKKEKDLKKAHLNIHLQDLLNIYNIPQEIQDKILSQVQHDRSSIKPIF